ncbi:alpha-hydroxy acid oxidase [Agrobacterium pusense]|uniref:alpha-hydroxy acid oxidase n=1 Tax=Agrobacterium pusense TaxID=648995 RepID=UPI001C6DF639|nr:alpha-hydroxy acid oxidase [Agrobacterium pusense]MBW9070679.1 alpha-hydroxy-acid oxidizing protein [Agrobacterium pusense]MBW9085674.1 alpha-hydroxy-acid oxidizing protein [Agrobacterium pusense]MBW9126460.1 alpha-hydroxy-acid oxidizing protein [Agrobacterium pusense]MBW9138242.1 alpha-hydroxy-acid oxidizing protein [Agrobacterium pusense]
MKPVNVSDYRELARRRLPKIFFDYIDGGSFDEMTMQANRMDFGDFALKQNVLVEPRPQDLSATYLGARHPLPFMLGPVGFLGLYAGGGEAKAVRAAHAVEIPFCLSTFSIASLADLRAETTGPLHFQLYVLKDRTLCEEFIVAAEHAGVDTLFVTVDTAITGIRERDVRNGFRSLTKVTPGLFARLLLRPRWLADIALCGTPSVRAIEHRAEFGRGALEQAANLSRGIDNTLSWKDIAWLRERWRGKLVIKGVLDADDAVKARDAGCDGIVISNHGGRQLDGASSTIRALPSIRAAVGPDFCLMVDGGIRRGTDIIKIIGLGADGVMLGRAYAYGLSAAGEHGVAGVIAILKKEISISLTLMGIASIDELKARGREVVTDRLSFEITH